jgi:hypothetical protein
MASPMFRSYELVMRKISMSNFAGSVVVAPSLTAWDAPVRIGTLSPAPVSVKPETAVAAVVLKH